jgi:predicted alpha/beta-hydrolase family hydrolase
MNDFKEQLKQWKLDYLAARKHGQKKPQNTRGEVLNDADISEVSWG